ncbi:membrane-spanning 4-domains subfamily A member 3 isoform X2 [Equus asinus]|uniref:membrane-spanning 4-domains subfamily A member 3 isoform X2 n=1 Tax=Equus asinus TaxID=9793 RepID=UPI001D057DA8|nr:membrane-spanning 4-domains subfamily A member 3 isoform X2 [Equus asinus]
MASQEVDNAQLGTASAGITPESQVKPEMVNNSVYQPIDRSQNYQKEEFQVLGAIQILTGAILLAIGVVLGSILSTAHSFRTFFFTFYTGYPLWGALFFVVSGSLSVAAGRKPTRNLMQNSFGMNIASATIALVGFIFLIISLVVNKLSIKMCPSSQPRDLCIYMGATANEISSPPNSVE